MSSERPGPAAVEPEERAFYVGVLRDLNATGIPYLVGGAYALKRHAGIERHTKDLDLFVEAEDRERIMAALAARGCRTEATFPHWLGKAYCGAHFIDVIHNAGNGVAGVDRQWFAHAVEEEVFGVPVRLVPAVEMIWQKCFIMERERFDGADVAHLIRAGGPTLDWQRLLDRFGVRDARVLLAHVVLFGFIYPAERDAIPGWVVDSLWAHVADEPRAAGRVCRGTFLSREQYLVDLERWGYRDARLAPEGSMSADDVKRWTEAIGH